MISGSGILVLSKKPLHPSIDDGVPLEDRIFKRFEIHDIDDRAFLLCEKSDRSDRSPAKGSETNAFDPKERPA